ncbi:hypothetical protein X464_00165 [Oenococcus oeni S23]|nr:hypothetical protein X282_07065 [Oenococcus oeni IOEB_0608]KGH94749.1 hypothetical protein X464_00165 [Oenococcus oeni S23]
MLKNPANKVGIAAKQLIKFKFGHCPFFSINKFSNRIAEMIVIGTKDKKLINQVANLNFFKNKNGNKRENQVTRPHNKIVTPTFNVIFF